LPLQTVARNQFYIIELEAQHLKQFGLVGRVRAWDWSSGVGWIPAGDGSGLPAEFGFGHREDPVLLAQRVATLIATQNTTLRWQDLVGKIPEVDYVLPQDLLHLQKQLRTKHGIMITKEDGVPRQIGKAI
jgi:hypothetical protein